MTRFDRIGAFGRRGFVTLFALDAAHYGKLDNWAAAADRLERDGWLSPDDASRLRLLWLYGGLIGNTDMHFGNVGVALDGRPCRLAPAYDMLPMVYRPESSGELLSRALVPPLPTPARLATWREAANLAARFWGRAAADGRISAEMRAEADRVLASTRVLLERFG